MKNKTNFFTRACELYQKGAVDWSFIGKQWAFVRSIGFQDSLGFQDL